MNANSRGGRMLMLVLNKKKETHKEEDESPKLLLSCEGKSDPSKFFRLSLYNTEH